MKANQYVNIDITTLITPIYLSILAFLFLINTHAQAQTVLTMNGSTYTINKVGSNNRTGSYQDFTIPSTIGVYDHIEFYLKGGDGGRRKVPNECRFGGGKGAVVKVRFKLGTGANELKPGGKIRFIVGEKGDNNKSNGVEGGGGGGGTAVLYLDPSLSGSPGCTRWISGQSFSLPSNNLSNASSCWILLGVAGGGGGAESTGICSTGSNGDAGRTSTSGSNGRGSFGNPGGSNGASGNCGGGGLVSVSGCGNRGGYFTGANGGNGSQNGGFGYGSGAGGNSSGGGGGGYSGGGSGDGGSGGGGGSFASSQASWSQKTGGGNTNQPSSGYITYVFQDNDPFAPIAQCKDIVVQLDASGSVTINASQSNNGSSDPGGLSLSYSFSSIAGAPASVNWGCAKIGVHVETLSVSNGSLSTTCTTSITVEDNIDPVPACQDIIVNADASGVAYFAASDVDNGSADNCTGASDLIMSLDITSANCGSLLPTHVTLTVSDTMDNFSTCTANVTVRDVTPPSITCSNTTISINNSLSILVAKSSLASASDQCGGAIIPGFVSIGCGNLGQNQVVITAREINGNLSSSCTATVTVTDTKAPNAFCKSATLPLDASGNYSLSPSDVNNGSYDNCSINTYSMSPSIFDCTDKGSIQIVTLSISDASGNTANCTAHVSIIDGNAPGLTCPANQFLNTGSNNCTATYTLGDPITDNCPGAVWGATFSGNANGFPSPLNNIPDGSGGGSQTFEIGTTTVSLWSIDASGNAATPCNFDITVSDIQIPDVSCPSPIIRSNDGGMCGAIVSYNITSSDNCTGVSHAQTGPSGLGSGDEFPIGTTTQTYTATDASGNTAACSFDITVNDTEAPTINCPTSFIKNTDPGSCDAAFFYGYSTADNCPPGLVQSYGNQTSAGIFPIGVSNQVLSVTDASGNTASCSFKITVNDNEAPDMICPGNLVFTHTLNTCHRTVSYATSSPDNCSATFAQTDNSGLSSGDDFPVGVTPQSYTATDASGNTADCSFTVTILDDQDPTISCPSNVTLTNDQDACGAIHTFQVTTADNCPSEILGQIAGQTSGSLFPIGSTTNHFTVTDASGNTASCSFSVSVSDDQLPTIDCPTNIVSANDPGQCGHVQTYLLPVGLDNCNSNTHMAAGLGSGAVFPIGTTIETYTVTDASGHTATCSFSITINDDEKPIISLQGANPQSFCEGDTYVELGATATDNCDNHVGQNILIDPSGVNTNQEGTYFVNYNVTDLNSNAAIQVQRTVIVKHTPGQLAPQNCGSCNQIRLDFCEGEAAPDLEALLTTNAAYEQGISFLWYADNSGSQGGSINTPVPNMVTKNTRFYWVSQSENDCEGEARRVRVRVRKTSTVVLDLPAIGCNTGQLDLAAWVSDARNFAKGYSFWDTDPVLGGSPLGSVSATNGTVNNGQYMVVSLPANPITYYATASNNTGCQITGSDEVSSAAGANLSPVPNMVVTAGDPVLVSFNSTNASHILWFNHSSFNNPYIGLLGSFGSGNLVFTAANISSSPVTATIRAIAYNGNCAGQIRDFTITVNPGTNNRQAPNRLQLTAININAHDVQLDWQIEYEFALTHLEIEKQMNNGDWEMIDHQDVDQHGVGSHYNVTLQDGSYLDRSGMGNQTKYRLKLVHPDGRAIWSQEVEVTFDFYDNKRFTLYPNPTDGRFKLSVAGPLEGEWRYKLSDQLGRTILIGKLEGSETVFDISQLPTAHYFLLLTSPEGKRYMKQVVKN